MFKIISNGGKIKRWKRMNNCNSSIDKLAINFVSQWLYNRIKIYGSQWFKLFNDLYNLNTLKECYICNYFLIIKYL